MLSFDDLYRWKSYLPELTEELVKLVERTEPDSGPEEGTTEHSLEDFENIANDLLLEYSPERLWVFAYGSLIWIQSSTMRRSCKQPR